jgi:hypothetical protein
MTKFRGRGGRPRRLIPKVRTNAVIAAGLMLEVEALRAIEGRSRNNMIERLLRFGVDAHRSGASGRTVPASTPR